MNVFHMAKIGQYLRLKPSTLLEDVWQHVKQDKALDLYTFFIWTAVLLQIIEKLELTATLWL